MEASGLKEGDKVEVKLIEIDKKTGKYRLSMRALTPKPEGYVDSPRPPCGPPPPPASPPSRGRPPPAAPPRQPKKD